MKNTTKFCEKKKNQNIPETKSEAKVLEDKIKKKQQTNADKYNEITTAIKKKAQNRINPMNYIFDYLLYEV